MALAAQRLQWLPAARQLPCLGTWYGAGYAQLSVYYVLHADSIVSREYGTCRQYCLGEAAIGNPRPCARADGFAPIDESLAPRLV